MPSIADLLTSMPATAYPRWLTDGDRIQWMPAEGRYAMLLHIKAGHWCGYVLVPNREAIVDLEGRRLTEKMGCIWPLNYNPRVSYSGPGSRAISWRWYNSARQLKTQAQLNPDGDWWVGFDTLDHPIHQLDFAREYLINFEHYINEYVRDHSSDSR